MQRASGILLCALAASAAQIEIKTESWANTDDAFGKLNERIVAGNPRNLLARKGVRCTSNGGLSAGGVRYLSDGYGGEPRGEGRAIVNGQPSVITFYLGQPKPIHQVGVFTFNGDARANQDFEVRFADNSKQPGKEPSFPDKPHLTTGDKILGRNGGGFHTWFVAKDGGTLTPGSSAAARGTPSSASAAEGCEAIGPLPTSRPAMMPHLPRCGIIASLLTGRTTAGCPVIIEERSGQR